jgi:hypothetical protein
MPNLLEKAAVKYGTDKRSAAHDYTRTYDRHLAPLRERVSTVLELGIHKGASLLMWKEYFQQAVVHGLDIENPPIGLSGKKGSMGIVCHRGNQTNKETTDAIADACGGTIDIVIDDASHKDEDQKRSFLNIWPRVTPGGYYIVEDVCCNYWPSFGNEWPPNESATINFFRGLVHDVNFRGHKVGPNSPHPNNIRGASALIADLHDRCPDTDMDLTIEEITFASSTVLLRKRGQL